MTLSCFAFIILNTRSDIVGKKSIELLPQTMEILETMGEQIKMARLRRDISAQLVAERANISRATLWNIEKGSPSVAIGNYAAVLHALNNMDRDLLKVAKDDEFGRKLQDLNISTKKGLQTRRNKLWKFMFMNVSVLPSRDLWVLSFNRIYET